MQNNLFKKGASFYIVGILKEGWNEDFVHDFADVIIKNYEELI